MESTGSRVRQRDDGSSSRIELETDAVVHRRLEALHTLATNLLAVSGYRWCGQMAAIGFRNGVPDVFGVPLAGPQVAAARTT